MIWRYCVKARETIGDTGSMIDKGLDMLIKAIERVGDTWFGLDRGYVLDQG